MARVPTSIFRRGMMHRHLLDIEDRIEQFVALGAKENAGAMAASFAELAAIAARKAGRPDLAPIFEQMAEDHVNAVVNAPRMRNPAEAPQEDDEDKDPPPVVRLPPRKR